MPFRRLLIYWNEYKMNKHIMEHDPIFITRYANRDCYKCTKCDATGSASDDNSIPIFSKRCREVLTPECVGYEPNDPSTFGWRGPR